MSLRSIIAMRLPRAATATAAHAAAPAPAALWGKGVGAASGWGVGALLSGDDGEAVGEAVAADFGDVAVGEAEGDFDGLNVLAGGDPERAGGGADGSAAWAAVAGGACCA